MIRRRPSAFAVFLFLLFLRITSKIYHKVHIENKSKSVLQGEKKNENRLELELA